MLPVVPVPVAKGNLMLRATYLFIFGVVVTFATLAFSQESSIEQALRLSQRTGKPIFAIASRKVCAPCQLLKSRVANHFQNRQIADQVVYLRVDLDDESWQQWSRQFPHQGRMLPIVYMIRADQRQMYGRSNTLPGDQLEKFLEQGVAHCGVSFSEEQIRELEQANQSMEAALEADQLDAAVQWLKVVRQYGTPGQLNSYATAAVRNNELVATVADRSVAYVEKSLGEIQEALGGETEDQFRGIQRFVELQSQFGDFENLADQFSQVAIKLAVDQELRTLWSLARKVDDANQLLATARSDEAKAKANSSLSEIESGSAPEIAKLAAQEVKRRHSATLASLQNGKRSE